MTRTPHTTDAPRARTTTAPPAAPPLEHPHPVTPPDNHPTRPTQDDTATTGPAPTPLDRP
ncbi:hypothetical protein [Streptomyces sp. NPDC058812]|uniref:hypothetical protein n=1 Tax=unclassified Streptomyces TaxID=2593676 RepID=UPI0036BB8A4C